MTLRRVGGHGWRCDGDAVRLTAAYIAMLMPLHTRGVALDVDARYASRWALEVPNTAFSRPSEERGPQSMAMQLIGGPQDGLIWTGPPDQTLYFIVPSPAYPDEPKLLHIYERNVNGDYRYVGVDVQDPDEELPRH
jgi:hypothetical protein